MAKGKIVLIEDNENMRDNIAEILDLSNYEVWTAANGKLGVELVQKVMPDIIICDVMMPELDGYGVLHILQQNPDTANIPFIFLTAKADKSDLRKGMNLGADDYLTKPFEDIDLLNAIEVRLKKNEMHRTNFVSTKEEIADFFTNVGKLKDFGDITNGKHHHLYKKKDFLFMEGEQPKELILVNSGKIKTYKTTQDGKELITEIHLERSFIGYLPLLENTVYHESAMAMEDSVTTLISKADFLNLIYSNKEVAGKFIRILAKHLADAEQRLLDIAYKSVRQRVASALLQVRSLYQKKSPQPNKFAVARKDLSAIVGTATESLNRTLADFKDEGMIEVGDHTLTILNISKLEKLAG
ncbi:MAG: response regulator [Flammeovirgaceae bacterium]